MERRGLQACIAFLLLFLLLDVLLSKDIRVQGEAEPPQGGPSVDRRIASCASKGVAAAGFKLLTLDAARIPWLGTTSLRLCASDRVHFDPENVALLKALPRVVRAGDAVLYHSCGTGLLGLLALQAGAASVHFADVSQTAVDMASVNARMAGYLPGVQYTVGQADLLYQPVPAGTTINDTVLDDNTCGAAGAELGGDHPSKACTGVSDNMEEQRPQPLSSPPSPPYNILLCNPPQLPGPPAMADAQPDRYGGPDGLLFYRALARLMAPASSKMAKESRLVIMQTSLSSFAAVDALFAAQGLSSPITLATQKRKAPAATFEALATGTLSWLLRLRARGVSDFRLVAASGDELYADPAEESTADATTNAIGVGGDDDGSAAAAAETVVRGKPITSSEAGTMLHFTQRFVSYARLNANTT